jgi:hypothetical protein
MRTLQALVVLLLALAWVMESTAQTVEDPFTTSIETVTVVGKRLQPLSPGGFTPEEIRERMAQARTLLEATKFHFVVEVNKRTRARSLRGRPVLFAAQSARDDSWHLITVEMPIPARRWYQGQPYNHFTVVTPGYRAEHVRGTGGSLLTFRFYKGDEQLYVFGRKYPDINLTLLRKRRFEELVSTAEPKYNLPYTPDLFHEDFVEEGKSLLERTAQEALTELRELDVESCGFPGQLIADTVKPETLVSLAVIEQMDDHFYRQNRRKTALEILNQYGLHGERAFTQSVSVANAIGPMQFTDRRGNGTYSLMVRRCSKAQLEPDFETGARDLKNAMKAAACLIDYELNSLGKTAVPVSYLHNPAVLAVFAVSAYNGGPDDAIRLYRWMVQQKMPVYNLRYTRITKDALPSHCPCMWMEGFGGLRAEKELPPPSRRTRFNRENLWYVEKYLFVLSALYEHNTPSE